MKIKAKLLVLTVIFLLVAVLLLNSNENLSLIQLAYASDSYGNDINWVAVYQWNGTEYVLRHNITSSGGTYRIHNGQVTKFVVNIKFNSSLASGSAEAIQFTRVYMNITNGGTIWNNKELNNTSCDLVGSFYILNEQGIWNSTGQPTGGTTYACSVLYQGYY